MGNEASTPSEEGHGHCNQHNSKRHAAAESDDDSDMEEQHHFSRPRANSMIGSLRGNVAAAAKHDEFSKFVDPVLSAAAAGAAVRKAKQARCSSRQQQQHPPTRQAPSSNKNKNNNEWKTSLQRLAKTAASTATSMAHVTAPVLVDASSIVLESAKEFATDVKDEFTKPKDYSSSSSTTTREEESVILFPYSPVAGRSWSGRSWYSSSNSIVDLSPSGGGGATPKTGGSDTMGRVTIDLKVKGPVPPVPNLKKSPVGGGSSSKNIGSSRKAARSVTISHFPELDRLHSKELNLPTLSSSQTTRTTTTENDKVSRMLEFATTSTEHQNKNYPVTEEEKKAPTDDSEARLVIEQSRGGIATTSTEGSLVVQNMAAAGQTPKASKSESEEEELTFMPEEVMFAASAAAGDAADTQGEKENPVELKQDANETEQTETHKQDDASKFIPKEHTEDVDILDEFRQVKQVVAEAVAVDKGVDFSLDTTPEKAAVKDGGNGKQMQPQPEAEDLDIFEEFRLVMAEAAEEGVDFSLDIAPEKAAVKDGDNDKQMKPQPEAEDLDILDEFRLVVEEAAEEGVDFSLDIAPDTAAAEKGDDGKQMKPQPEAEDLDILDEFRPDMVEAAEEGVDFSLDIAPEKAAVKDGDNDKQMKPQPEAEDLDILDEFRPDMVEAAEEGVDFSLDIAPEKAAVKDGDNGKQMQPQPEAEDLDIFDEFRLVVEEAAEEGVDFSLDIAPDTAAAEKGDDGKQMKPQPEAEELDIFDEFRLVVAEAAEEGVDFSLDIAPDTAAAEKGEDEPAKIIQDEDMGALAEPKKGAKEEEEEVVFENDAGDGNDEDDDRVVFSGTGWSNNSQQESANALTPLKEHTGHAIPRIQITLSKEETRIVCSPEQVATEERELDFLLERLDSGEEVDEDRLYELELFERYRRGEELNTDEMEDFQYLMNERRKFEAERGKHKEHTKNESRPDVPEGADPVAENIAALVTEEEVPGESEQIVKEENSSTKEVMPSPGQMQRFKDEVPLLGIGRVPNVDDVQSAGREGWLFWALGDDKPTASQLSAEELSSVLNNTEPEAILKLEMTKNGDTPTIQSREKRGWLYWARFEDIGAIPKSEEKQVSVDETEVEETHVVNSFDETTLTYEEKTITKEKEFSENEKKIEDPRASGANEEIAVKSESEEYGSKTNEKNVTDASIAQKIDETIAEPGENEVYADDRGWLYWARLSANPNASQTLTPSPSLPLQEIEITPKPVSKVKNQATMESRKENGWLFWARFDEKPNVSPTVPTQQSPPLAAMMQVDALRKNPEAPVEQVEYRQEQQLGQPPAHWHGGDTEEKKHSEESENAKGEEPAQRRISTRMTTRSQTNDQNGNEVTAAIANSKVARELRTSYNPLVLEVEEKETTLEENLEHTKDRDVSTSSLGFPNPMQAATYTSEEHATKRNIAGNEIGAQPELDSSNGDVDPQPSPRDQTRPVLVRTEPQSIVSLKGILVEEDNVTIGNDTVRPALVRATPESKGSLKGLLVDEGSQGTCIDDNLIERPGLVRTQPQSISTLTDVLEKEERGHETVNDKENDTGHENIATTALSENFEICADLVATNESVDQDRRSSEGEMSTSQDKYIEELKELLDRSRKGEEIDEERIYFLKLYERRLSGGDLLLDELSYLEEFETIEAEKKAIDTSAHEIENKISKQSIENQTEANNDGAIDRGSASKDSPEFKTAQDSNDVTNESEVNDLSRGNGAPKSDSSEVAGEERKQPESGVMEEAGRLTRLAGELATEVLRKSAIGLFRPTSEASGDEATAEAEEGNPETVNSIDREIAKKEKGTQTKSRRSKLTQSSALFAANATAIYATGVLSDSWEGENGSWLTQPAASKYAVELLDGSKNVLKAVFERATADDTQAQKQRFNESYSVDLAAHKPRKIVHESVFLNETKEASSDSLSPPGSPRALSMTFSADGSDSESQQGPSDGVDAPWDLMPARREIRLEQVSSLLRSESMVGSTVEHETPLLETQKADSSASEMNYFAGSADSIGSLSDPRHLLSPKMRRGRKPGRLLLKAQRQGNEKVAGRPTTEPFTVPLDGDAASSLPGVSDTEDLTDKGDKDNLDVALLAFSSLESVDFLNRLPQQVPPNAQQHQATILWRLLLANWKHAEMWKEMVSRPCSLHFQGLTEEAVFSEDYDSISSGSTIRFQFQNRKIQFSNTLSTINSYSVLKNLSGFKEQRTNGDFVMMSKFLCDIGPPVFLEDEEDSNSLRHIIIAENSSEQEASPDVTNLLQHAESHLDDFFSLVRGIVEFSSQNDPISEIKHEVGMKNYSSTRRKGARKYGGDILQVKDVIRGQITFPDENSLICGLYHLHERCQEDSERDTKSPQFAIVRLKNLFRTSNGFDTCLPPLPTGYKHVLINIRIRGSIIAELQFQLAQFFGVMGSEGYSLHQELSSFGETKSEDNQASQGKKECSIERNNFLTTDIVKQLISMDGISSDSHNEKTDKSAKSFAGTTTTSAAAGTAQNESHSLPPKTEKTDPAVGGVIAGSSAAVAAVAAKASKSRGNDVAPREGGIAEIAAAAAKNRATQPSSGDTDKVESAAPSGGLSIAAAAAAAAKGREKPTTSSGGGIAAAAAAAAAAKKSKSQGNKSVLGGGGIAAIAAAAAKNRARQPSSGDTDKVESAPAAPSGGLSIAAAAAAAAKGKLKPTSSGGGGIAAAAAAKAAAKASKSQGNKSALGGGGIAAIAAAAAKNRATQATAGEKANTKSAPPSIAAAAAAAAASKSKDELSAAYVSSGHPTLRIDPTDKKKEETELLKEAMGVGAAQAASSPRDLPCFYCLYLLAKRLDEIYPTEKNHFKTEVAENSENPMPSMKQDLLLRSLAISNQASSLGMVGWLEYGSSNPLERRLSLPFEVLQQLAYNLASDGDWHKASDVLGSLVMRCEQHLPSYHPTTLSSMLDLAAASSMVYDNSHAKAMVQTVSDLVGVYLSEHEAMFFDNLQKQVEFESDASKIFLLERTSDSISMMQTFATTFRSELSRDFLALIGPDHKISLLNHSLVADAFAVLANCVSAGGNLEKENTNGSLHYWSLAYLHYQHALRGWTKIESLSHPNAASAAYSIARCLRELGRMDQALRVLGSLVACLQVSSGYDDSVDEEIEMNHDAFGTFSFLPPQSVASSQNMLFSVSEFRKEQTLVQCLWTMATMTVEQSPDERGRVRALSLLHRASDTLRNLLHHADAMDDSTRLVCFEVYECVEQEAIALFEPLRLVHLPVSEKSVPVTMKLKDSLTSMRRKRWQRGQHPSSGTGRNSTQILYPVQQLV